MTAKDKERLTDQEQEVVDMASNQLLNFTSWLTVPVCLMAQQSEIPIEMVLITAGMVCLVALSMKALPNFVVSTRRKAKEIAKASARVYAFKPRNTV